MSAFKIDENLPARVAELLRAACSVFRVTTPSLRSP